jgi:hypothetical protein
MNYPFEKTKRGYPILDTEEKLQWYMNRLLHRDVDLFYVNAEACDLDTVYLRRRKCSCLHQAIMSVIPDAAPTFIEPDHYGRVDRSVVAVLRAIHARREAELEAKRKEDHEKWVEEVKAEAEAIKEAMKEEDRWTNRIIRRIWGEKGKETHE